MGIKTVPHRPYSLDVPRCDFWLFPKLRGCRYETIEEMKEVVTKVIDTLTQENFQKFLEWYKNSENIFLIVIKYLHMNQILALENSHEVDMPFNK